MLDFAKITQVIDDIKDADSIKYCGIDKVAQEVNYLIYLIHPSFIAFIKPHLREVLAYDRL